MIKLVVLVENKTYKGCYIGEHGLSMYIKSDEATILYDAAASDAFIKNAKEMNIDLAAVDYAVLSHGHHDHAGGFAYFPQVNTSAPLYAHKDIYNKDYPLENGKMHKTHCGVKWTDEEKQRLSAQLVYTEGPKWITSNIVVSGSIPPVEGFEIPAQFFLKNETDGSLTPDKMAHEQFLAIYDENAGGVFVFSGCSHTGVVPCLRYAKTLFPNKPIKALIAGMHLYGADAEYRQKTISEIFECDVDMYVPLHCTGIDAICEIKAAKGNDCILLNTGDSYVWR